MGFTMKYLKTHLKQELVRNGSHDEVPKKTYFQQEKTV